MVSSRIESYSSKKIGINLDYIKKVKFRHFIGISTTCGYQYFGEKTGFNVGAMFALFYFALLVLHNIFNPFFAWMFYHLTCLPILEGDIICISNYYYEKYFSIYAWVNSGVPGDAKVKDIYNRTT